MNAVIAPRRPPASVRILVAEDSPTQAQRLLRILHRQGWEALLLPNGQEALDQALRERPALIISDVVMPVMDGYELTRRVKADPALRETPVILLTTMSDPQDVIRGLECGADSFILKPYDEQHLVGRVQYMLLNRELRHSHDSGMGVEIHFNGQRHYITADRLQILNLLLSTYDAAIQRNQELSASQEELERKTEEVESANRFLDSVIENIPVALVVTDAQNLRCISANRAAEALIGRPREQLVDKALIHILPPEAAARLEAECWRVLEQGTVADNTWLELETLDHGKRQLYTRMVPVMDANGHPEHLLVMCDDVTEKVRAEAELRRAQLAAEDATRMKSEFLANMSHEIRTPLNAVLGMTQLALKGELDSRQRDYLEKSLKAGRHLLGVLNDILDLSKIEAGKLTVDDVDFDLEQVLANVGDLIAEKAGSKGLQLVILADKALPAMLRGDPLRLSQVLLNLASNAVKFTEHGSVTIDCRLDSEAADSLVLRVTVTDTGLGMTPEQCSRLFSSFQQADASITRRFGGTGLGLVISKRLVHLMGGEIGLSSTPGEGSTFWFTATLQRAALRPRQSATVESLRGRRILVADDNEPTRIMIMAMLKAMQFSVAEASSGDEALRAIALADGNGAPFDALLLDWQMPGMDGIETARRLSRMPLGRRPAVLLVTAFSREDVISGSRSAGISDVLIKPVGASLLSDALANALGARPGVRSRSTDPRLPAEAGARDFVGTRVLLVEDNPANQEVAGSLLALRGVSVQLANDGRIALDLLAAAPAGHWDAVFMDMQMPVMDGIAATQAIRQLPQHASLPIIAMTANALKEDRDRCLAAGMNDHIAKPIDEEEMFAALLRWAGPPQPGRVLAEVAPAAGSIARDETAPSAPVQVSSAARPAGPDDGTLQGILADLDALDAAVAHDLRSGIGVITGFGTLIKRRIGEQLDAKGAEHLDSMRESAQESTSLVTAWREAGKVLRRIPAPRSIDMAAIAAGAAARANAGMARMSFAEPLSPEDADPDLVERAWFELLANAAKFTRPGDTPWIEAFGEMRGTEQVYGVRDRGIGVPANRVNVLFRPVQRVHGGDYPGAGLGLFVASRLVARCGGSMWVDEQYGAGEPGLSICFTLRPR